MDQAEADDTPTKEEAKDSLWRQGVIHHLAKETYFWNFSLVYKERQFDVIKWRNSNAWKVQPPNEVLMNKAMFIGADAGVFFISVDDKIDENFSRLADMMDIFIEKTKASAPFIVYAVLENKQKIAELKTNKDMMKNLADVKKWTAQHKGEFRIENLTEVKMNLSTLVSDYCHSILSRLKTKTMYPKIKPEEIHYIDFEDLVALKEIEEALAEQLKGDQTVDELLFKQIATLMKKPEFKEEVVAVPLPQVETPSAHAVAPDEPSDAQIFDTTLEYAPDASKSVIKAIIYQIRMGIRRQCPKCFNYDRTKIFESVDKENILMLNPTIYGFKFRCGNCGNEWHTKKDWKAEDIRKPENKTESNTKSE